MKRTNISSGSPWEDAAGYSRAVRIGNMVFVAGTVAATASGEIIAPGNAYEQTVFAIQKIETALQQAGAKLTDVVRTRLFVTDAAHAEAVTKAHVEFFGNIKPACTLVAVKSLILPDLLVEVEADVVVVG